jgi:hypothetical protein
VNQSKEEPTLWISCVPQSPFKVFGGPSQIFHVNEAQGKVEENVVSLENEFES